MRGAGSGVHVSSACMCMQPCQLTRVRGKQQVSLSWCVCCCP
jgi:hypothetical protein